jgi:hypothetical protein
MLEFLLEGAFAKDLKTGAYNWEDQRKPQETANFELKLHEARQALRDDMMSLHLITKDQVLKGRSRRDDGGPRAAEEGEGGSKGGDNDRSGYEHNGQETDATRHHVHPRQAQARVMPLPGLFRLSCQAQVHEKTSFVIIKGTPKKEMEASSSA